MAADVRSGPWRPAHAAVAGRGPEAVRRGGHRRLPGARCRRREPRRSSRSRRSPSAMTSARRSWRMDPGRRPSRPIPEPRLGQPSGHRARPPAVLRHAPVASTASARASRATTRRGLLPTAATAASASPARTATPSRSPTCGSTAGSDGRGPPTACGRRACARSSTPRSSVPRAELVRERLAADAGTAAAYTRALRLRTDRRRARAGPRQCRPRRWRRSRRPSPPGAPPSMISATRWSAATRQAMARYPPAAQRGLKIFVGKGRCTACHFGANFTNGEFDDVGVPFFAEPGRVDPGRHGGIATLRASPFNLLGRLQRRCRRRPRRRRRAMSSRCIATGASSACPRCATLPRTAPYMHNGSLATLRDVVRHYSEVDEERLHGDDGARLIRAAAAVHAGGRRPGRLPRDAFRQSARGRLRRRPPSRPPPRPPGP